VLGAQVLQQLPFPLFAQQSPPTLADVGLVCCRCASRCCSIRPARVFPAAPHVSRVRVLSGCYARRAATLAHRKTAAAPHISRGRVLSAVVARTGGAAVGASPPSVILGVIAVVAPHHHLFTRGARVSPTCTLILLFIAAPYPQCQFSVRMNHLQIAPFEARRTLYHGILRQVFSLISCTPSFRFAPPTSLIFLSSLLPPCFSLHHRLFH